MRQLQATSQKAIPSVFVFLLLAAQLVLSSSTFADHCDGEYGVCKDQAQAKRDLRTAEAAEVGAAGVLIVAAGCGLGCIGAGPAYPVCVTACVSIGASATALIVADEVREAHDQYRRDLEHARTLIFADLLHLLALLLSDASPWKHLV